MPFLSVMLFKTWNLFWKQPVWERLYYRCCRRYRFHQSSTEHLELLFNTRGSSTVIHKHF